LKRVAAIQSSYIPWRGYFDIVALVDEFILVDDVQFTKRDWRNRNRIKTAHGLHWLTIPVHVKGRYEQRIDEVEVSEPTWAERHWKTIQHSYAAAPFFEQLGPQIGRLYEDLAAESSLSAINLHLLEGLAAMIGVDTPLVPSTRYAAAGVKTERLVNLCRAAGATEYLSGPAARVYLDEGAFHEHGISVRWMDYGDYPEYPQLHPPFAAQVSLIDLLLNVGPATPGFMKHVGPGRPSD
jgi:hypothetical protein